MYVVLALFFSIHGVRITRVGMKAYVQVYVCVLVPCVSVGEHVWACAYSRVYPLSSYLVWPFHGWDCPVAFELSRRIVDATLQTSGTGLYMEHISGLI